MEVEVGPLQKHFPLHRPFLVLENNVFAHYEQIPGLFTAGQDPITLDVVVPSLTLSNQNPVLQATVERAGLAFYQTAGGETPPWTNTLRICLGICRFVSWPVAKNLLVLSCPCRPYK